MKLKVFTLPFDEARGAFDGSELEGFLEHREAVTVIDHFHVRGGTPVWAVLVGYTEPRRPGDPARLAPPGYDQRADLGPDERRVFEAVRRWRNERATREGKPPYVLLTNRMLADIARARPASLAELQQVRGIGERKSADYGAELVEVVRLACAALDAGPATEPARADEEPADGAQAEPADG